MMRRGTKRNHIRTDPAVLQDEKERENKRVITHWMNREFARIERQECGEGEEEEVVEVEVEVGVLGEGDDVYGSDITDEEVEGEEDSKFAENDRKTGKEIDVSLENVESNDNNVKVTYLQIPSHAVHLIMEYHEGITVSAILDHNSILMQQFVERYMRGLSAEELQQSADLDVWRRQFINKV